MAAPAETRRALPRVLRVVVTVALALALAGLAFWAGRTTLQPAGSVVDAPTPAVVAEVSEQTVGRSLNLNVTVSQETRPLAVNTLAGVVTWVSGAGTTEQGGVLYRVRGRPVTAIAGSLPFYRSLHRGISGEDVRQLRRALVGLKLLSTIGQRFDSATERAVRRWQAKLHAPVTGRIVLGEAVAVPKLPSALSLNRTVLRKGELLSGGERVVLGRIGQPTFALEVSNQQAKLIPTTATIAMTYQDTTWPAVISDTTVTENNDTRFTLTAPSGGPVCAKKCSRLTGGKEVYLPAQVQVIPPVTGPAVPVAAITTNPDGTATVAVVGADDALLDRRVKILGSQDGVAVVDGLALGERVQVMAGAQPSASSSPR